MTMARPPSYALLQTSPTCTREFIVDYTLKNNGNGFPAVFGGSLQSSPYLYSADNVSGASSRSFSCPIARRGHVLRQCTRRSFRASGWHFQDRRRHHGATKGQRESNGKQRTRTKSEPHAILREGQGLSLLTWRSRGRVTKPMKHKTAHEHQQASDYRDSSARDMTDGFATPQGTAAQQSSISVA